MLFYRMRLTCLRARYLNSSKRRCRSKVRIKTFGATTTVIRLAGKALSTITREIS